MTISVNRWRGDGGCLKEQQQDQQVRGKQAKMFEAAVNSRE